MVKSKAWNWELVEKDNKHWNSPSKHVYYLAQKWKEKGFKKFLDVGIGFGRNALYMAKQGYIVNGFDLSEESVKTSIEKFKKENLEYESIKIADMLEFPYEDNSFDCILAMNVISHTDTKGFLKILNEILRVLKPSGEAYFTLGSKESFWFKNPVCKYVDENTRIRIEDGPENGIPHFYVNDDDIKKMLSEHKIIEITNIRELTQHGNFSPHYHIWLKK